MKSLREQLVEFHQAVNQPVVRRPTVPSDERIRLRAALILEEAFECLAAMVVFDEATTQAHDAVMRLVADGVVQVDLPALVDGLADLDYVVEGTRLELGVDGTPVANEVHRANMTKASGPIAPNGKRLKPPGFQPPDIEGELRKQGWDPDLEIAMETINWSVFAMYPPLLCRCHCTAVFRSHAKGVPGFGVVTQQPCPSCGSRTVRVASGEETQTITPADVGKVTP